MSLIHFKTVTNIIKYGEYSTLDSGKQGKFKNIFKTDRLQLTDTNGITSSKTTRI